MHNDRYDLQVWLVTMKTFEIFNLRVIFKGKLDGFFSPETSVFLGLLLKVGSVREVGGGVSVQGPEDFFFLFKGGLEGLSGAPTKRKQLSLGVGVGVIVLDQLTKYL